MQGLRALETNENTSRTSLDGMKESLHFSVPQAFYHRAWVLCAVDLSPASQAVVDAGLSFGVALLTMIFSVFYLPVDTWVRAFLGLGIMYLTTSAFTLAKCVRDAQEDSYVVSRIDQARFESLVVVFVVASSLNLLR